MNFDPIAELNVGASQLEIDWLAQIENAQPGTSGNESGPLEIPPISVVRVPDFFAHDNSPAKHRRDPNNAQHQADLVIRPNQVEAVPDGATPRTGVSRSAARTSRMQTGETFPGSEAVARHISRGVANQVTGVPMTLPISSDLIEKPEDWIGGAKENEKEERHKTENSSSDPERVISVATNNIDSNTIAELADQILNRFPLAFPTVLLFAGSEWNPHVDETCAQVAYQLASRNVGKVLLADSEFEKSELTNATGTEFQPGMAEIFNKRMDIDGCIADHDEANMDFLPVGNEPVWHWRIAGENIRSMVKDFKSRYQFVCVSVGDARSDAAKIWAAEAEGAFLVVSLANSSRTVAKSAVDQMHANGARLLGCIVSDAVSQ